MDQILYHNGQVLYLGKWKSLWFPPQPKGIETRGSVILHVIYIGDGRAEQNDG